MHCTFDNLKLWKYLRNVNGTCVARQSRSAIICAKAFFCLSTIEMSFQLFQQPVYLGLRFSLDLLRFETHVDPNLQLFFHPISFTLSHLDCTDQWTYSGANIDFVGPGLKQFWGPCLQKIQNYEKKIRLKSEYLFSLRKNHNKSQI